MKTPKISIIVPVYNVEKYIRRCIDSILNQTFKDFELILVDDGSPDRCGEICEEYALRDIRIKVIHKENGGQASARNVGLDIAQGDYIGFVDSDDWIDSDMYEILYNEIIKYQADIASCKCKHFYENRKSNESKNEEILLNEYHSNEILDAHYDRKIDIAVCTKLINRKKIGGLKFKEGMISEDVMYSLCLYTKVESIIVINQKKYIYFHRANSTTTSKISEKRLDNIYHSIELCSILPQKYIKNIIEGAQRYIVNLGIEVVNEETILENKVLLKKIKFLLKKNKILSHKIYYKKFYFFSKSPFVFCLLYRMGKEIKNILKIGELKTWN